MNPWAATDTDRHTPVRSAAATTSAATSAGARPSLLAAARAPLAWKSTPSSAEGRSTGSAPGDTASKAGARRAARVPDGEGIPEGTFAPRAYPPRRPALRRREPGPPARPAGGPAQRRDSALRGGLGGGRRRTLGGARAERVGQDDPLRAGIGLPAPHPGDGRGPRSPPGEDGRASPAPSE